MNAFSAVFATNPNAGWNDAFGAWSQMRGRMIEIFARTEMAVTATLQSLARIDRGGVSITLNPILNQRFNQLADLLSPQGEFSTEGKKIVNPLKAFGEQIPFRNFLCHGHSSIYLDQNGRWIVQLQMPSVSKGQAQMSELLLTEESAKQKLGDLHREAARLTNQLKQLCERTVVQRNVTPSVPAAQASR